MSRENLPVAVRFAPLVVSGLLIALAGCRFGDPPAARLIRQSTLKCQEAADLLAGVKDAAAAKAAAPRLKKLVDEIDRINEQIERIYDPSEVDPADEPAIHAELPESIAQMQRLMTEASRIRQEPALVEALGEAGKRLAGLDVLGSDPLGIEQGQP
jgi:hypothetical protein